MRSALRCQSVFFPADFIEFYAQMKPQEQTVDRRFVNSLNTQGSCVLDP